jgi:hypothetical protein
MIDESGGWNGVRVEHISIGLARALEEIRTGVGEPELPCIVCGEPTRNRSVHRPVCEPYGPEGEVVKQCRWLYLGEDPPDLD